jgi:hypothetical protein
MAMFSLSRKLLSAITITALCQHAVVQAWQPHASMQRARFSIASQSNLQKNHQFHVGRQFSSSTAVSLTNLHNNHHNEADKLVPSSTAPSPTQSTVSKSVTSAALCALICASTLALSASQPLPAMALDMSSSSSSNVDKVTTINTNSLTVSLDTTRDTAGDTVQAALQALKSSAGRPASETVSVYEGIAAMITEGQGLGGAINYQGIQLERGYIADEDTTIYNPGLTLLTESEKAGLVKALVASRKANQANPDAWNIDTQAGYDFLREKLDPLHMYELGGYLSIFPFWAGLVYLAVVAVQQFARSLFPAAYLVGVAVLFGPVLALVAAGPQ